LVPDKSRFKSLSLNSLTTISVRRRRTFALVDTCTVFVVLLFFNVIQCLLLDSARKNGYDVPSLCVLLL